MYSIVTNQKFLLDGSKITLLDREASIRDVYEMQLTWPTHFMKTQNKVNKPYLATRLALYSNKGQKIFF